MNPAKNPSGPSAARICIAPILIGIALIQLLLLAAFQNELAADTTDWLALMAVAFNLAGLVAAWGVRRHLIGRASVMAAVVLTTAVAWEFFRS